jgi:hypothetical protein
MSYIDTLKTINTNELKTQMFNAAHDATDTFIRDVLKGEDAFACGFAWVNIDPRFKGNTLSGRMERKRIRELGFELDYTGKRFSLWNPSRSHFQNIDCKEAGARAAAKVLESVGFDAYPNSRLD